jgi:predicted Zn-dependent protease
MLDKIIDAVRRQDGADDWLVRHISKTSTQHYVTGSRPESARQVTSEYAVVTVMNDHPSAKAGAGKMRGEAEVTLLPTDLPHVKEKLSQAVFMASLTDNPLYGLPGIAEYPAVDVADSEMQRGARQVAERAMQQLMEALHQERDVRLSSAEAFVEERHITLQNSQGLSASQAETNMLLDYVLLASGQGNEMESHIAVERRRATDLDVVALARRQSQYARDALIARAPKTGTFPVVISDDALAELVMGGGDSPLVFRSSAQVKYQQMTPWEVGKTIFPQPSSGDAFTMYSNAVLPFGTDSSSFDSDGFPGQRWVIVDNGVLQRFWARHRYAQYLQVPATGNFANIEIAAGSHPFDSLLESEDPLYHIVAFSAMSPDPITGDFVGEIRLGYELQGGQAHPIKGGSISGNLFAALSAAELSQETAFLGNYQGPYGMRFPNITVAGA